MPTTGADNEVVTIQTGRGAVVPVVFDSPHSGSNYPSDFDHVVPVEKIRKAEDMYVDELFANAPDSGATLITALFPRSYIDPNRSLHDLDPELLTGHWPEPIRPGEKARLGHGLIWRLCPPDTNLYVDKLSTDVVRNRIDRYWRPYHDTLRRAMDGLYRQFNAVWHVNCHSMPSSTKGPFTNGGSQADFVLGDRDGTTSSPEFMHLLRDCLRDIGYSVKVNDPYKGVEIVRAYSNPERGRHSIQLEINRALYMDEDSFERLPQFDDLKRNLDRLIGVIADYAR
ncbi:MAG: N-formylglutamate amidohydrolase [Pseudomonadota bacterium]